MKHLCVLPLVLLTAGCSALGGIPSNAVDAIANAGGGCIKVNGVWGTAVVMVASADKGVIRNGEVSVAGGCEGVMVKDAASVRAVPPVPGTVTTINTPATVTTIVTPSK